MTTRAFVHDDGDIQEAQTDIPGILRFQLGALDVGPERFCAEHSRVVLRLYLSTMGFKRHCYRPENGWPSARGFMSLRSPRHEAQHLRPMPPR